MKAVWDTKAKMAQRQVAAYIRVSTDNDEQQSSFNLQRKEFTDRINANPLWENAGIYSDENDAKIALKEVLQYYPEAYIKYSGAKKTK